MVILAQESATTVLTEAWTSIVVWVPKFVGFLLILLIGYFVARMLAKAINAVLERVGFDRAVERGGVRQMLSRSQYDASDILAKVVFYAVMLFVLQLAFGVFGPNPISDIIRSIIAFLPKIFVAIVIIVVAAAIAAGVRDIVRSTTGTLPYGETLATIAYAAILMIGIFAALNQVEIAPEIVNGLFYAILAIIAGIAIIAIGGGGIAPMRAKWEQWLARAEREAPRLREEVQRQDNLQETREYERTGSRTSEMPPGESDRAADRPPVEQPPADRPPVERPAGEDPSLRSSPEDAVREAGRSRRQR